MTSTSFVLTELANTMKYGGGFLYDLVFTEWRQCFQELGQGLVFAEISQQPTYTNIWHLHVSLGHQIVSLRTNSAIHLLVYKLYKYLQRSLQTLDADPLSFQCTTICDAGAIINQHWVDVLC